MTVMLHLLSGIYNMCLLETYCVQVHYPGLGALTVSTGRHSHSSKVMARVRGSTGIQTPFSEP